MKTSSSRLVWPCIVTLAFPWCACRTAHALSPPDAPAVAQPPIRYQVLRSWKADVGDHAIYLNQVAPPALPPTPVPAPAVVPQGSATFIPRNLSAAKKSDVLFLSATVLDHRFTELRWTEDGRQCSAFSNVDFSLLAGTAAFETADTAYSLMLTVRNVATDANTTNPPAEPLANPAAATAPTAAAITRLQTARRQIPQWAQPGPARGQYVYMADEAGNAPQERQLAALDALHLYHDANRQLLAEQCAAREAARIAEEQSPKSPPPPKPDTVVNFWPGPGTVLLDATRKEAKP